jgi:hypothetical protein
MDLWILLFPLSQTILLPDLTIGVTRPVSDKNQAQLLNINEQMGSAPGCWCGPRLLLVFCAMFFVLFVFCLCLVPNTARVPGLSILECHFNILRWFTQLLKLINMCMYWLACFSIYNNWRLCTTILNIHWCYLCVSALIFFDWLSSASNRRFRLLTMYISSLTDVCPWY